METLDNFKISLENLSNIFDQRNNSNHQLLQETLGITDEMLQRYYQAAAGLIEAQRWDDARDAFLFLIFINATVYDFWMGLGVIEQSTRNFEKAIPCYMMAEAIQPEDPVAYANAFQCCLAIGERDAAERFWEKAIDRCGDKPDWVQLKNKLMQFSTK